MIPSLFISHGSPELVLRGEGLSEALREVGNRIKELYELEYPARGNTEL